MKDYIQRIISAFTASRHNEILTKEIHQWLVDEKHADEKEAALHTLWEETEGKIDTSTWNSLSEVYDKVGVNEQKKTRRFRIRGWQYTAAAVVIFAISISGTFFLTKNKYSEAVMVENFASAGNMNIIELPDGSKVQTNSGTLLLYPETFKGDTRTVYLIGEANFRVMKNPDKPFIVKSGTVSVTALGTEFNVAAYPETNEIIATLLTGKIKVDCNGGKNSYILNPGEQIVYQNTTSQSFLANANIEDVTAWQKGLFVFRGKTMKEILFTLERRFNVTFQCNISSFSNDKYNFSFRQNASIEEIMNVMGEIVGGFNYKIEGNVCYIKTKK
ncbi:FecR family protein [Bacteroides sp.]|uniref:FecR family protein n=1 Tax=Bacteroides sp. TaxID=29523 RepID=UPI0025B8D893|nr:FecR family protein [Bacteroides sp.]